MNNNSNAQDPYTLSLAVVITTDDGETLYVQAASNGERAHSLAELLRQEIAEIGLDKVLERLREQNGRFHAEVF